LQKRAPTPAWTVLPLSRTQYLYGWPRHQRRLGGDSRESAVAAGEAPSPLINDCLNITPLYALAPILSLRMPPISLAHSVRDAAHKFGFVDGVDGTGLCMFQPSSVGTSIDTATRWPLGDNRAASRRHRFPRNTIAACCSITGPSSALSTPRSTPSSKSASTCRPGWEPPVVNSAWIVSPVVHRSAHHRDETSARPTYRSAPHWACNNGRLSIAAPRFLGCEPINDGQMPAGRRPSSPNLHDKFDLGEWPAKSAFGRHADARSRAEFLPGLTRSGRRTPRRNTLSNDD
jgi:hypothetical protein